MENFFCHLPFVAMDTDGQSARPCCSWAGPGIPLKGYQQNQKLIEIKNKLFQGQAPRECRGCVVEETNSGKSLRTLANDFHPHLSQEVLEKSASYSSIKHVAVVGSNICNLQCLPCVYGSYKRSKELHDIGFLNHVPMRSTISNIEEIANLEDIEQITLCSGEPFYDKDSLRLLDLLIQTGRSQNLRLDINTNLTSINKATMDHLVENFNQVVIKGSIDGIHEVHEYLRYPSSWSEIHQAVLLLLSMPKIEFVITTALSNLSLLSYADLVKYFKDLGVQNFFISSVTNPIALHNGNLPPKLKLEILEKLVDLKNIPSNTDRLLNSLDMCINICRNDYPWDAKLLADFMQKHDDIRDTNWRRVWPMLAEFY